MSQNIDYQQSSFNAGELSPLVKGREGLEKFKSGLKTCENALVLAHGPVTSRGGLRYIGEVKDSSKKVRLVPFEFNEEQAYALEIGDEYMRVWMDGGQVVTPDADTVFLCHFNGDDGDIDFTDKSQNAHAITAVGNAQVDTVDPIYTVGDDAGNLLLDGDGDYLSIADHADFDYGSESLTIDLWFYLDSVTGEQIFYYHEDTTYDYKWIACWVDPDVDEVYFVHSTGSTASTVMFTYSAGFAIDTWYHVAVIRGWGGNADDWMITINGVALGTAVTRNMTLPDYDQDPRLGHAPNTFMPDHSPQNHTVRPQDNAVTKTIQYKWGNGSIFLDGTGDYIKLESNGGYNLETNTVIDLWVKHSNHLGIEGYVSMHEDEDNCWVLRHEHGVGIKFVVRSGGSTIVNVFAAGEITDIGWHHVAVVKLGTHYGIYKDGVLVSSILDASTDVFVGTCDIGRYMDVVPAAQYYHGYVDDIRIQHSDAFSVDPLDWIDNDSGASHYFIPRDAGDIYKWGPSPDYTNKKWGLSAIDFDGADDEIRSDADHADWNPGTNRTIDMWVKHTDHVDKEGYMIQYEDINNGWRFYHNHGVGLTYHGRTGGSNAISLAGGEITDTDWHHVAMCQVGAEWGLYLDGIQTAHDSGYIGDTFGGVIRIGVMKDNAGVSKPFDGRMDEIRFSHANEFNAAPVAGLTDTITVPTGEHTTNADTKILLHCNCAGLTVPTGKHTPDSDTEVLIRGDVMDVAGGFDEYRISTATRWTSAFSVNVGEYPGAGGSEAYELASTPWTKEQLDELKWAGLGDILYVVHPNVAVYKISRTDHDVWTCNIVEWDVPPWKDMNDGAITLTSAVFSKGDDRALVASSALFSDNHKGTYIKFNDGWGIITDVTDSENAVWDIKDALTGAGPTADWYMSAWNGVDGYPSAITFFEDRLILSGAGGEPIKIRGSETGEYENMDIGVDDSDPFAFQLLMQKQNKVLWLVGGKKLFIGTSGAEFWMSGAGTNAPITPTSVLAKRESTIGSADIQPVTIGSSLIFVQRAGRTVNLWKYEYINDSFEATDLGILAEHLMKDYAISDIQYAQNLDHIAWILRTDGTLLGLTNMQDHDVTGWHKHKTTDSTGNGDIETFAVIPGTSQSVAMDELWMVVNRTIDKGAGPVTARYIEMLTPRFGHFALQYAMNLDSCMTYIGTPATVFSGADHLEGEAVNILADGKVFNTTISSGGFTLANAASVVTMGLGYTVTVEFLVALLTELVKGVTTAKRKRIVELLIMMYETCQLDYGVDISNMFDVWDTVGLADNTLNDEYIKVEVDGNPEYEPTLMLTQDYPYPFTLLGIVETIEVED